MRRFDPVLKEIFASCADTIIYLATGTRAERISFLDTELRFVKRMTADLLVKVEENIFHIEIQLQRDPELARRLLFYFVAILHKYGVPPFQILVWLGSGKAPVGKVLRFGNLTLRVYLLDFSKVQPEAFLRSQNPDEVMLSIFCSRRKREVAIQIIERMVQLGLTEKELLKYIEKLSILGGLFDFELDMEEVERVALQKIKIDPKKTFLYRWGEKEGFKKGVERGIEKGMEKGIREGQRIGVVEGLREAIKLDVEVRFGKRELEKISNLIEKIDSVSKLKKIKRKTITAKSFEELFKEVQKLSK